MKMKKSHNIPLNTHPSIENYTRQSQKKKWKGKIASHVIIMTASMISWHPPQLPEDKIRQSFIPQASMIIDEIIQDFHTKLP